MKIIRKTLCVILSAALCLLAFPVCMNEEAAAAGTGPDTSLALVRPRANVTVTELTRVAYSSNSMKAPAEGHSVIVKSTPSGIPYLSSSRASVGYAGETPQSTVVSFTPGVTLSQAPVVTCNNSTVTFSSCTYSNGTYTWTVTGGSAYAGTTLIFTVNYTYSEENPITGKTYSNTYSTSAVSYVEAIATPAGIYSTKRTYEDWGLGTTTKNRSYVASFMLGKNSYGSLCSGGSGDGSVAFGTSLWSTSSSGWTGDYGVMRNASGSDASRNFNVGYNYGTDRPLTTMYFDTSLYSTLSDLNLRLVTTILTQSDESDEVVDVKFQNLAVLAGNVKTNSDSSSEDTIESDAVPYSQLSPVVPTNTIRAIGSTLRCDFTGVGPGLNSLPVNYTVYANYQTPAGWSSIYVAHTYALSIVTYNKGALRTLVDQIKTNDPSVMSTAVPNGDFKGYNPQSWYYQNGWGTFINAYYGALECLDRPNVSQNEINQKCNVLQNAYNDLELATADYSVANAYYNQAMSKIPSNYTLASWARLQTLLDNYSDNYSVLYQPAVDKMAADIKTAIDDLEERYADYSNLLGLLNMVNTRVNYAQVNYGKPAREVYNNWTNLEAVLSNCGCIYDDLQGYVVDNYLLISDQATVDGYVLLLQRAIENLSYKGADYTLASRAEAAYNRINPAFLVDEVRPSVENAYNALTALHGLDITHQHEIDTAVDTLNYWLERVEYKPADISAANALIAYAGTLDRTMYSSFSQVDAAIATLRSKLGLDIRYQSEINRAVSALQSAIDQLLANSADYSQVDAAIENADEIARNISETYEDTYGFTADVFYSNWSAVTAAVNAVVRGLDTTRQSTVDSYASAINTAISSLTESNADYTAVNALQNEANGYINTGTQRYTQASIDNLTAVYLDAPTGLKISRQSTVDAYAVRLSEAIAALEYLPANYSGVNTQISSANTKLAADDAFSLEHPGYSLYTPESVSDVNVAIASVVDGLDIRYQSTVNGYASAIQTAVRNLVYSEADYSEVYLALANIPEDTSIYTNLSLVTLNSTVNNINYTLTADRQSTVDRYVTNINNAVSKLKLKTADYSGVTAALAQVPSDPSPYTTESWQFLQNTVNSIEYNLDVLHQETVDNFARDVNTAVTYLVYLDADYSEVDAALESVPADLSVYTDETAQAVSSAVAAVVRDYNVTRQDDVDAFAAAINSAVAALELKGADYSAVNAAVTAADTELAKGIYTDESAAAVQTAINAVVRGKDVTEQSTVDGYASAINSAVAALVLKNADYSAVDAALNRVPADLSVYTEETAQAVTSAVNSIERGYNITRQAEVDTFATAINSAVAALELKGADYSSVNAAVTAANTELAKGIYTDESAAAVQTAINAVVTGKKITEQSTVDGYATAINSAVAALVLKDADYSAVNAAVTAANTELAKGIYTDESAAAVQTAVNAVVTGKKITEQSTVDGYAAAINSAVAALVLKNADYSAVDAALNSVPADLGVYTEQTAQAVASAVSAVERGYDITRQSEVDAFAAAINSAVAALMLRGADYSAVNAAVAAAQTELAKNVYTDESLAALQASVDAVVTGKDVTEQSTVDGYADAINSALASLTYKPADFSALDEAVARANTETAKDIYTDESIAAVRSALDAASAAGNMDITQQDTVDAYAAAINSAVSALVIRDADYSAVDAAVAAANTEIAKGIYTDESVAALQSAIDAVVTGKNVTEQNTVDSYAAAINSAAAALVLKNADYSSFDAAVAEANSKIATGFYTDESAAAVLSFISTVDTGLDVRYQSTVDEATAEIVNLTNELVLKLADYTELQNILDMLDNSESEIYNTNYENYDEIMGQISTYRNNVVALNMDLTADRQSDVDNMVQTLRGYIESLIPAATEYFRTKGTATVKNNVISGLEPGLSRAAFESKYLDYENVTLRYTYYGSRRYVSTGTTVTVTSNSTGEVLGVYTLLVYGDIDGDGEIGASDISILENYTNGTAQLLTGVFISAANLVGTRKSIDEYDVSALYSVVWGDVEINQVTGKV